MAHKFACEHCGEEMVLRAVGPQGRAICRACGRRTAVPKGVEPLITPPPPSPVPASAAAAKVGSGEATPQAGASPSQGPIRLLARIQFILTLVVAVPYAILMTTMATMGPMSGAYGGMGAFSSMVGLFAVAYIGLMVWLAWLLRAALFAVADGLDDLKAIRKSLGS